MGQLTSIIAGVVPMAFYAWILYYLDRYEREPIKLLIGVFLWGAIIAAGAAFVINSITSSGIYFITHSEFATQLTISTIVAPVVEETLKGTAVLIVFLFFRSEFDSLLDGLIYGGITALGFAATENAWYIYQMGYSGIRMGRADQDDLHPSGPGGLATSFLYCVYRLGSCIFQAHVRADSTLGRSFTRLDVGCDLTPFAQSLFRAVSKQCRINFRHDLGLERLPWIVFFSFPAD